MHIFLKNSKFSKWICHENIDPLKLSKLGTLGSNRQAAGRFIFVWLGLLDTLLLPALAKLLSHKQSGC
jgi:hypothetical protein